MLDHCRMWFKPVQSAACISFIVGAFQWRNNYYCMAEVTAVPMFFFFSFHDCACHRVRCSSMDEKNVNKSLKMRKVPVMDTVIRIRTMAWELVEFEMLLFHFHTYSVPIHSRTTWVIFCFLFIFQRMCEFVIHAKKIKLLFSFSIYIVIRVSFFFFIFPLKTVMRAGSLKFTFQVRKVEIYLHVCTRIITSFI